MGVVQSIQATTGRIEAGAAGIEAIIRALLAKCRATKQRRSRTQAGTFWATGDLFCRVGGVLSQANAQNFGNRGEVTYNGETHVFVGYDPDGTPRIERRRNPGPGRDRRTRQVVPFRRPNNDLEMGSLGLALCRQGDGLKRRGRRPSGR